MSKPLSWRAETGRQLGRRRTKVIFAVLLALPLIFIGAFSLDNGGADEADPTPSIFDVATSGNANFTLFVLFVSAELLLFIVAALFAGDAVPAEASWSSLRYLLTAPVSRARLLTSKLVVGLGSIALSILVLPLWSFLTGTAAYGMADFQIPAGGTMPWSMVLPRLGIAMIYLFISILPIAAIAFTIGVGTNTPLAAVGGSVIVLIVSGILDSIDALGSLRNGLPGHYSRAWMDLFAGPTIDWADMRHGVLWAVLYALIFTAWGYRRFRRRDVLS